jgi:hypothetical protein
MPRSWSHNDTASEFWVRNMQNRLAQDVDLFHGNLQEKGQARRTDAEGATLILSGLRAWSFQRIHLTIKTLIARINSCFESMLFKHAETNLLC